MSITHFHRVSGRSVRLTLIVMLLWFGAPAARAETPKGFAFERVEHSKTVVGRVKLVEPQSFQSDAAGGQAIVKIKFTDKCSETVTFSWKFDKDLKSLPWGETFSVNLSVKVSEDCARDPFAAPGNIINESIGQSLKHDESAQLSPFPRVKGQEGERRLYGKDGGPAQTTFVVKPTRSDRTQAYICINLNAGSGVEAFKYQVVYIFRAVHNEAEDVQSRIDSTTQEFDDLEDELATLNEQIDQAKANGVGLNSRVAMMKRRLAVRERLEAVERELATMYSRLSELMSKWYMLKDASITMSKSTEEKLIRIAKAFTERTGAPLVVTDGDRSPDDQALQLYKRLQRGENLSIYSNKPAIRRIKTVYFDAIRANKGRSEILAAMTAEIADQVARGDLVSRHLAKNAIDIRSKTMTDAEKRIFKQIAEEVATNVILEGEGTDWEHFHVGF